MWEFTHPKHLICRVSPKRVSVRIHASETLDLTSRQGVFSPYKKKKERREKSTDPIFSSQSYLRFQIFPQRQERRIDPFAHRFQNFPKFHNFTTDLIYIYIYIYFKWKKRNLETNQPCCLQWERSTNFVV